MTERKWRIAVNAPIFDPLTYLSAPELSEHLRPGIPVVVPLGKRSVSGVVVDEVFEIQEGINCKFIQNIEGERIRLSTAQLKWSTFLAEYYVYPLGQVLESFFPPLKRYSGTGSKKKSPIPLSTDIQEWSTPPALTLEQAKVLEELQVNLKSFHTHLLFGVTGSGKTEVYIRLIEAVLAQNKKALFLVPEISLTPQLLQRITARFPGKMAVLHSQLTDREKTEQWWNSVDGEASILLGARSALFCPLPNLGLIIVDEEHESSFKQDEKLRYNARDAAVMRAKFEDCPVVLGSATPSLESWNNVVQKKYHVHMLRHRVANRPLPTIEVVDLRIEREKRNEVVWNEKIPFWLSLKLYEELKTTYQNKEQAALFLNRRGMAQAVVGQKTNIVPQCPNCDISLTLHGLNHLLCHYCAFCTSLKEMAKHLNEDELRSMGVGTELIEDDLQKLFPSARIARADRDEITSRGEMEDLIRQVENHEIDFLVGTQMIAKGLDFPSLTLVGLILADVSFNLPDFRANEKSYQLLSQVSGRPGRHLKPGRVIVQTLNPYHPILGFVERHDFLSFAEQELEFRKEANYPPLWRIASVRFQAMDQKKVEAGAKSLGRWAQQFVKHHSVFANVEVLGPSKAPIARLRNLYRYHLLIKADHPQKIQKICRAILDKSSELAKGVKVTVDIDPQNLM